MKFFSDQIELLQFARNFVDEAMVRLVTVDYADFGGNSGVLFYLFF